MYIQIGNKIDKTATKHTIARPSKIYPNRDFWFENIPSGNPAWEMNCGHDIFDRATAKGESHLGRLMAGSIFLMTGRKSLPTHDFSQGAGLLDFSP
jgi:hypothetical protein